MAPLGLSTPDLMSPEKNPSGKLPVENQPEEEKEEEAKEEQDMQIDQSLHYSYADGAGLEAASQNRRSDRPVDFRLDDPFGQEDSADHQESSRTFRYLHPSRFQNQHQHAMEERGMFSDQHQNQHAAADPYNFSFPCGLGTHPSGMGPLEQFPPLEYPPPHVSSMSRSQSFDLGFFNEHGGHPSSMDSPMPYPPNLDATEGSHYQSAGEFLRFQAYSSQRSSGRMYPTQDRNPHPPPLQATAQRNQQLPPPYAAAHRDLDPPYPGFVNDQQAPDNRSSCRSTTSTTSAIPQRRSAKGRKASPKKGPAARSKVSRRRSRQNDGSTVDNSAHLRWPVDIPTSPTTDELEHARTARKQQALITWYKRLDELIRFKKANGHANVPQQYDMNHSLGIWVNKQRMEKKGMDAGEKTSMTPEKVRLLEKAGFIWAKRKGQAAWEEKFRELQQFQTQNGHCDVPTKNKKNRALGRWVSTQRSNYKKYKLGTGVLRPKTDEDEMERRIRCLEGIAFKWSLLPGNSPTNEEGEGDDDQTDDDEEEQTSSNPLRSSRRSKRNQGKKDDEDDDDDRKPSFSQV